VRQLLSYEPEQRPSAAQVIALVDSRHQPNTSAVDELREEYQCSLCKSLVVDAVSACSEDHIFCFMCLDSALQDSKKCPTCQQEMTHPKTQRVVNNMAEKLAARSLTKQELEARQTKRQASLSLRAERGQSSKAGPAQSNGKHGWQSITGEALLGSECSVLRHSGVGSVVEIFHVNGWFRFRSRADAATKWCNSCCVLGDSVFGAPGLVAQLDAQQQGEPVEKAGVAELNESNFWLSRLVGDDVVLTNVDEETVLLKADGSIVWLSHEGMDKGLVVRPDPGPDGSEVTVMVRQDALALLGVDSAQSLFHSGASQAF
jgi:hypothetical protein